MDVLDWMVNQKQDETIERIDRETLFEYIGSKDFLAVIFCKCIIIAKHISYAIKKQIQTTRGQIELVINFYIFQKLVDEDDPQHPKVLRHIELIDDEAAEYGIKIVKTSDLLMAKKYGYRNPPGVTYFRKGIIFMRLYRELHYSRNFFFLLFR